MGAIKIPFVHGNHALPDYLDWYVAFGIVHDVSGPPQLLPAVTIGGFKCYFR